MNDFTDIWTPTGLVRIAPCRCSIGDHEPSEQCCNQTTWEYNRYPVCIEHIQNMYDMFPDDREALQPALDEVQA